MPDTELLEYICNENEKDRDRLVGRAEDEEARRVKVPSHVLRKYAGTYAAGPLGEIRVLAHGDELAVVLPGGGARHAAFATSEEHFVVPALGVPLTFLKDHTGVVTHMRVTSVEGDIDAPRVATSSPPAR